MKHLHGGDIYRNPNMIDFSANINPLGMPDCVREAAKKGIDFSQSYPDVECSTLRKKISQRFDVAYEEIICGNGAADLIFTLVRAITPKKALLLAPTFAEYEQALESVGCAIHYYNLKEEEKFLLGNEYIKEFYDKISQGISYDMIFLCNPNNPTGQPIEYSLLYSIVKTCRKVGCMVVLDECFVDFLEEPETYSMISQITKFPNLFILKAFTKMYAMAGIRLGYGFTSDLSLIQKMRAASQPWNVSIPAQMAGMAALDLVDYEEKTRVYVRNEKRFLLEGLEPYVKKIYGTSGNYIFFQAREDLYEQLKKKNILIRDCSNYRNLQKGFYRIAVRTREENKIFLEALRTCSQSHNINNRINIRRLESHDRERKEESL